MISIKKKFVDDPFYRYKMEKIDISIKNKKTIINNLINISNTLKIEPKVLFRFITSNLASFGQEKNGLYIISGAFDINKIQDVIYIFIDKYILCKKCNFPEIENGICKACGIKN